MQTVRLSIERLSYGPYAIAHTAEGKTVFLPRAVPGDIVEAEIVSREKSFDRARIVEVLEPSPVRVVPPLNADLLDTCPWANVCYETQLKEKRANIVSMLTRIAKLSPDAADALVEPCADLGQAWHYRNKAELNIGFDGKRYFCGPSLDDGSIAHIHEDPLLDKAVAKSLKALTGALNFLMGSHELNLDRVGIRYSARTKECELALWGRAEAFPRAHVAKVLHDALKPTSIVRVMHKGTDAARKVVKVESLYGKGSWQEILHDERMRVSAPSFFQVNTNGAEKLIELVLNELKPEANDEVMDLYCGAGTFTLPLARRAAFVSAVESYGPAVRDLRRNIEIAALDNIDAIGGDANRQFPQLDADVIVVDPPRAGLDKAVCEQLSNQNARAIAYVSCDPATLARDIARFSELGAYHVQRITPVDLFPQTFHVECVCLLAHS